MSHASWLSNLFDNDGFKKVVKILSKQINQDKRKLGINCIVGIGISGVSFASVLSYKTNLPLVIVRKSGEKTHSSNSIEYSDSLEFLNYCVIDDLIDQGNTIKEIYNRMGNLCEKSRMVKIYLYNPLPETYDFTFDNKTIPVYSYFG